MPTWELDDPTEIAQANRYTFYKPSAEIIAKVSPGDTVKLIFRGDAEKAEDDEDDDGVAVERMWVLVDVVHGDGRFEGRLDNEPYRLKGLKAGDPVQFEARHIIDTDHDDPDSLPSKYVQRCYVSDRVLRDGMRIGQLYREAPTEEKDSGWRFWAGDEDDDYDDFSYVSLGAVLSKDDSVIHLLESPEGAEFGRDEESGEFVPV